MKLFKKDAINPRKPALDETPKPSYMFVHEAPLALDVATQ